MFSPSNENCIQEMFIPIKEEACELRMTTIVID